ncbi:class I SAM-dependent methyltransferase [Nocardioides dilutus]
MSDAFDRDSWERRWAEVLRSHADAIAARPANAELVAVASSSPPGRALDAGCGHGAETLWLAGHGWRVTAVDFADAALEAGRATAASLGDGVAERIDWVQGDLGVWEPDPAAYELVVCLYVHVDGAVEEMVGRLGSAVAPGGTLLLVGHVDAPGQQQVTVPAATAVLTAPEWEVLVAEERTRSHGLAGTDAVVRAVRAW